MFLDVLLILVCIAIIILSLLQGGKSEGIVSALTGQNSNLFAQSKERDAELFISRATMGLGIALFVLAILIEMR
jgi:protein translocase, SecG subunit